jgi:hypothetical protein
MEIREVGGFDYLFAGTSRGVWRQDYALGGGATWGELDSKQNEITPGGAIAPEVRSIAFGADTAVDGQDDLYAVTWGFGVLRHESPDAELPESYVLEQNYPNPFNPQTNIRFALPETGKVRLMVVDLLGRTIATLVDGTLQAGSHEVVFDAQNLPSGTYLYQLEASGVRMTRLLSLVK